MRMTNRGNRRKFYVVQFLELPFEGIDDCVSVPHSWCIVRRSSDKVVVTYPNNEDPIDTRDRVKRRERPNDKWRFYMARIKYESENYSDAEYWIARNDNGSTEEESEIRDTQPESVLNRELPSGSQLLESLNSDNPQLDKLKPYKNTRKPLPRISIRRPLSQSPDKNLDNKRFKLNGNGKPGIDTDLTTSGCSKQERSIIITDNQLIQNDQAKTSFASDGETNTEQSTQPGSIKENRSVDMSVQSSSKKLAEPSPKLSDEQQLSQQPPTDRQPPPQPPTDRQPAPKFPAEQPSPVGLDYQQPLSMAHKDPDESGEDIESCQNVLPEPVTEERPSTKTPPNFSEQAPQPEPINERSTVLVRYEHALPDPHPQDISVRQLQEPNDSQKTHPNRILTAPTIVPRPPSTANQPFQQYLYPQLPILPASSALYSKPKPQEMDERNSIKAAHNHQKPRSQGYMYSTPSTSHHEPNWKKMSQVSTSPAKKQYPVMKNLKNPVDQKTRFEGIPKNYTTMQYPLNSMMQLSLPTGSAVMQTAPIAQNHLQAQVTGSPVNNVRCSIGEKCMHQCVPVSEGIMNTSAAENLSKLAHQYISCVGVSHEQQYLSTQEDYLQQLARLQDMLGRPNMARTIDQRVYHQNPIMNGAFVNSQPNPINQPIQFLPQNQYIPVNSAYAQDIRHELMRGPIDRAHTTFEPNVQNGVNIQLAAYNSSNQSHQNPEHPHQKQDPPNYQDPCTASTQNGLPLKSNPSSQILRPQVVTKRPRSVSTSKTPSQALLDAQKSYLFQELGIQGRVKQSYTEYSNMNLAAVLENITVEPAPTTKDSDVQTMPSSDRPHETQSTLAQSNHIYRHPRTNKTIVDQATETDSVVDVDHWVDEIAGSPVGENSPKVADSACQTDECLMEEQGSVYQEETASDSENATEHEIESENEVVSEANQTTLTTVQNLTQKNQQIQSRTDVEQDMLSTFGTLFTQMGANLSFTRDMFENLRNSIRVCAQTYETLLEKVDKFNSIETLQIPTSPPNNVTSQVPPVNQGRSARDNDDNTGVDAPTPIREQRGTFSLPAEYDPNDTKWTLKHRKNKPGLVELLPRTGIYVNRKELKRCKRESKDCRTLARLLLTEVFSMNALSVCSLTGGKAKAFNSVNIDVRPGLDEHAKMVLLTFVEDHGRKHGWIESDTPGIMSTIRTKINDIRAKHEQKYKV